MSISIQPIGFDDSGLTDEERERLREAGATMQQAARQTIEGILTMGRVLVEMKAILRHGQFGLWIRAFGLTESSALRLMNVYVKSSTVEDLGENIDKFTPTVLYLLAERRTPAKVIQKAVQRAKAGETVTKTEVQAMKRAYALAESTSLTRPAPKPVSGKKPHGSAPQDARAQAKTLLDKASKPLVDEVLALLLERMNVSG